MRTFARMPSEMLAPGVKARETAAWETPAMRATSCAEGGPLRLSIPLWLGRGKGGDALRVIGRPAGVAEMLVRQGLCQRHAVGLDHQPLDGEIGVPAVRNNPIRQILHQRI